MRNIICFINHGLHLNLGRRFARCGGSLSPFRNLANDRFKAVILVSFLLYLFVGVGVHVVFRTPLLVIGIKTWGRERANLFAVVYL